MKKILAVILVVILVISIVFLLYKAYPFHNANQSGNNAINSVNESDISDVISDIPNQNMANTEILFLVPLTNTEIKLYSVSVDGKNLKEILTLDKSEFKNTNTYGNYFDSLALKGDIFTDGTTISYIKNNIDKFKYFLTNYPLYAFSNNFCAYSTPISTSDTVSGGACFKGVYLYNMSTGTAIQIDKMLDGKLPNSSFSKDGNLFITSLSFSQDGKFLFVVSYPDDEISVFSLKQMKFIGTFQPNIQHVWHVDKVENSLYFLAGTDTSNVYQFDIDTKSLKAITNCTESSFVISPDGQNLVFIEAYVDEKNDLGILDLKNGNIKKINYQKGEKEVAGFVVDSRHLIVKRLYKVSDTDPYPHVDIYLLNLNTLKQAKLYSQQ